MNHAQNYLKHADREAEAILSFGEEENDHLIFVASLECGDLGHKLSYSMQAFQIWYLAMYPDKIGHDTQPVLTSKRVFTELPAKTGQQQLILGHAFLETVLSRKGIL